MIPRPRPATHDFDASDLPMQRHLSPIPALNDLAEFWVYNHAVLAVRRICTLARTRASATSGQTLLPIMATCSDLVPTSEYS